MSDCYSDYEFAPRTTLSRPMSIDDRSWYSHKSIRQPIPKPASPPPSPPPSDTVAMSANSTIIDTEKRFRQNLDSIDRGEYTLDGLRKQLDQFDLRPVDNAVEKVCKRVDDAERDVQSIREGLAPDRDVANQIHASRVWARAQRRLDNTRDGKLTAAARDLIAAADRGDIGVLVEELPSYLVSRGQGADWVDSALEQKLTEYADARKKLVKARQSATIVESNARVLRNAVARAHEGYKSPGFVAVDRYDPDA